jgi:flagella synthesis protein FlgN
MSKLTRGQAHAELAGDVHADLEACAAIFDLLQRQFDAAVRHQGAELAELAGALAPLLEAMEARRVRRVALVRALLGPEATMAALVDALKEPLRARLGADWAELEQRVRACKQATTRNGNLLAEQFSVMQRVRHGEEQLYAPR